MEQAGRELLVHAKVRGRVRHPATAPTRHCAIQCWPPATCFPCPDPSPHPPLHHPRKPVPCLTSAVAPIASPPADPDAAPDQAPVVAPDAAPLPPPPPPPAPPAAADTSSCSLSSSSSAASAAASASSSYGSCWSLHCWYCCTAAAAVAVGEAVVAGAAPPPPVSYCRGWVGGGWGVWAGDGRGGGGRGGKAAFHLRWMVVRGHGLRPQDDTVANGSQGWSRCRRGGPMLQPTPPSPHHHQPRRTSYHSSGTPRSRPCSLSTSSNKIQKGNAHLHPPPRPPAGGPDPLPTYPPPLPGVAPPRTCSRSTTSMQPRTQCTCVA